jgi:hypothetical protein
MLIHGTIREECTYYLRTRARQGFTVVQTVILSEMNGVNGRSALGEFPLIDGDPTRPNEAYFNRVVEIVDEAKPLLGRGAPARAPGCTRAAAGDRPGRGAWFRLAQTGNCASNSFYGKMYADAQTPTTGPVRLRPLVPE